MSVDLNRLTAHLSPQQQDEVKKSYHRREEHSTAAFLYCFFLGIFGAHRFYLHQWRKGFAHLIIPILIAALIVAGIALQWPSATIALSVIPLLVIALVWEIINLFTIDAEVYQRNLKLAEQLVAKSLLSDTTVERRAEAKLDAMVNANVAQAEAVAQQERVASDAAAVSAAAPEALPVAPAPVLEAEASSALRDEAVGVSTGQFVQTTETQISDTSQSTRDASREEPSAPTSWSETEAMRAEDTESAGGEEASADVAAVAGAAGAIGAAGAALFAEHEVTAGEAESAATSDAVMRTHEETGYSVSDSVERTSTYGVADAVDTTDETVAEAEPLPTPAEASAPTWADYPAYTAPADGAGSIEAAAPTWPDYPSYVEPSEVAAPPAPPSSASQRDVTDLGFGAGDAVPVADVATEGGVPLRVVLPGADDPVIGMDDAVASQPAFASEAAAPESVLLVPEEDATASAPPSPFAPLDPGFAPVTYESSSDASTLAAADQTSTDTPTTEAASSEPVFPAPVIAEAAGAAAFAGYAALASDTPTLAPVEPVTPQETLAELSGYATMPADTQARPVDPAEPSAPPAEPEVLESHSDEVGTAHHAMRRIRVVRQVKVDGQVVEETAAEEYIDADADPAPVRQRLQDMLRQQAAARQQQAGQANV